MVTVNPRSFTSDNELIDAYKKILAPSLGHFLDGGMDPAIKSPMAAGEAGRPGADRTDHSQLYRCPC